METEMGVLQFTKGFIPRMNILNTPCIRFEQIKGRRSILKASDLQFDCERESRILLLRLPFTLALGCHHKLVINQQRNTLIKYLKM